MTTKSEGMMIPGKLKWYAILALALWLAFSGVAAAEQLYVNESGWWRDGGVFNASTAPIQAAVDAADVGGTIYVWNGSYTENVNVYKQLTLVGDGADVVTVTAVDSGDHVFEVTADYVNISGFLVRGETDPHIAGIYLSNANYCSISGNDVYGLCNAIYLLYSSNNTLTNNTANSNSYGIFTYHSSNNTLTSNSANSNVYDGIYMTGHSSNYNMLESNTANSNNDVGIGMDYSSNNTLENNTANSNNWGGICLWRSSNNILKSNTANSNSHGIHFYDANNNNIACNDVRNNTQYGFRIYDADNNNITYNLVQNNTGRGFYIHSGSRGNNISYNNIIENGNYNTSTGGWEWQLYNDQPYTVEAKHNYWGAGMNNSTIDASIYDDEEGWGEVVFYPFKTEPIPCAPTPEESHTFTTADAVIALQIAAGSRPLDLRWDVSRDGSVTSLDALMILCSSSYHNNLINNNAYDSSTNQWDFGSAGNYWSDHTGIGDTPHPIPGGESIDRYPLMGPWTASADATPVVTITAPVSGSIVNTPNVTGTGFATDDVGIVGMGYEHHWESSSGESGSGESGSGESGSGGFGPINASTNVSINWTVYLQNGTNTMRVTAVDEAGNSGNASVTVIYGSLRGDLNSDGTLTNADAAIALEIAVGGSASCDPMTLTAADVSGDGKVTSLDALMILQAAAGSIEIG